MSFPLFHLSNRLVNKCSCLASTGAGWETECLGQFSDLYWEKIPIMCFTLQDAGRQPLPKPLVWSPYGLHALKITLSNLSYNVPDLNSICTHLLAPLLPLRGWVPMNNLSIFEAGSSLEDNLRKHRIHMVELSFLGFGMDVLCWELLQCRPKCFHLRP